MPTVDYTPSNAVPAAIARPDQTPLNAAPVAVALGSMAGTAGAPAAVAFPAMTPSEAAPVLIPRSSQVPDNTAPAAVELVGLAPTAAAPVAVAWPSMSHSNAAPAEVPSPSQAPSNTPPTPVALPAQDGTVAAPASVPIAAMAPLNEAPRIIGYRPTPAPLTDDNVNTPILKIEGALVLNSTYGQTRIPVPSVLERAQLALESAPLAGPATLTLVDAAGVTYNVAVTVAAGETFAEYVLPIPLALPAGANVRAKCTATPGGENPGGFGVLTLFTRLST